ncbi:hypothetical protein RU07_15960 [Agrobacterium tumefaciens]|uniref:Uncharacterized protein n=1 Tax=Agrobacterium tumefaciens TaxID=358 RepID=A0A0D0J611_AGRTU|nr:hypothetical protein RU07_15960 [Agrobacterium tumefaciens]
MADKQSDSSALQQPRQVVITTPESTLTKIGAVASIIAAVFTGLAVVVYLCQYSLMRQQLTAADRNRTIEGMVMAVSDVCKDSLPYVSSIERLRSRDRQAYDVIFKKETISGKSNISANDLGADGPAAQKAATSATGKLADLQTSLVRFTIFASDYDTKNIQPAVDRMINDVRYIERYNVRDYLTTPAFLAKVYEFGRNCLIIPSLLQDAARGKPRILPLLEVTVQ